MGDCFSTPVEGINDRLVPQNGEPVVSINSKYVTKATKYLTMPHEFSFCSDDRMVVDRNNRAILRVEGKVEMPMDKQEIYISDMKNHEVAQVIGSSRGFTITSSETGELIAKIRMYSFGAFDQHREFQVLSRKNVVLYTVLGSFAPGNFQFVVRNANGNVVAKLGNLSGRWNNVTYDMRIAKGNDIVIMTAIMSVIGNQYQQERRRQKRRKKRRKRR